MRLKELLGEPGRAKRLAAHAWRHFQEDRCFEEAASLGYTSLLAMVPLLAVVFGVVSVFPVFDRWADDLQSFIFSNFVPAAGEQVQLYVEGFMAGVGKLTLPGTVVLILTALLLMLRIEKAFNRIWRVTITRNLGNRIAMYWAVLTLGPLAMGAAAALSAQPLLEIAGYGGSLGAWWRSIGIFALTWLGFSMVFLLVPNRQVLLSHATVGAFVSAVLFSIAKGGFAAWVSNASFNLLYGTLATVPIFLFWLYLVWVVILLGASLSASLTTFSDRGGAWRWPWKWEFLLAFRVVGHLFEAQKNGQSVSLESLLQTEEGVSDTLMQKLVAQLDDAGLVTQDSNGDWLLTRDLGDVSLLDLYRAGRFHLPLGEKPELRSSQDWDAAFVNALGSGNGATAVNLEHSLKSLYQGNRNEVKA